MNNKPIKTHYKELKEIPASTKESEALSKDLKKRGMTFVDPKIIYSFIQTIGIVNDHIVGCWRYQK